MSKVRIIPRREWGARPPSGGRTRHSPREVVIHHTVYPTLSKSASPAQEKARMRTIQDLHQKTNGWLDFAYHLCIFPSGRVYRGRPLRTIGSHVANNNTGRVGIVFDGNFETGQPSENAMRSLRYLLRHHDVLKRLPVKGHRDFGGTACPGKNLYAKIHNL